MFEKKARLRMGTRLFTFVAATLLATGAIAQGIALPGKFQKSKVIRVAVQTQYPPLNYVDVTSKKLTGFNVDLLEAIGVKLGVKMEMVETAFAQMVPGLETDRFDVIGTGLGDFATRREKLTLVDYIKTGPILISLQGKADAFKTPSDVCGKTVGYVRYVAAFSTVLKNFNEAECVAKGKPPIQTVTDDLPVMLGLVQNRYEVALIAVELLPWLLQTEPNKFHRIGDPLRPWLLGLAFRKEDGELRDAIAQGLRATIKDGSYARIAAKYKLDELTIKDVTVDAGNF